MNITLQGDIYMCCRWLITRVASFQPTPLGAYFLTQWHQDWRSNDVNDLINTHWWFEFVLFMLQHTTTRSEVWASSRELQLLFNYVTMILLSLIQWSSYHSGALLNQFTQFMRWKCLSWYQLHAICIQEFLTMMAVTMATTKVYLM